MQPANKHRQLKPGVHGCTCCKCSSAQDRSACLPPDCLSSSILEIRCWASSGLQDGQVYHIAELPHGLAGWFALSRLFRSSTQHLLSLQHWVLNGSYMQAAVHDRKVFTCRRSRSRAFSASPTCSGGSCATAPSASSSRTSMLVSMDSVDTLASGSNPHLRGSRTWK